MTFPSLSPSRASRRLSAGGGRRFSFLAGLAVSAALTCGGSHASQTLPVVAEADATAPRERADAADASSPPTPPDTTSVHEVVRHPEGHFPRAEHVIIISEDGLRPDALIEAKGKVHTEIMHLGSWSLSARTIRHASTLPSHAAMLSGFDMGAHHLDWNTWKPERGYIQVPTVFDAAEEAGDKAAAFVGKQKLKHITRPGSVALFSRPGFFCKKVVEEAAKYFVAEKPRLEFIHFSDPDERGHAVGWMSDPQIEAIRHTDRCLGTLLEAVTAAGLDKSTLFILSADHGGHGRNHSGNIMADRLIPWIAWGPGVRPNHRLHTAVNTMDTAATVLWALGYQPPKNIEGRPVLEAFEDADPQPAP